MAKVCIPKEYIDEVKEILIKSGNNSTQRLEAFKQLYGGDLAKAQELNLRFENNLVLKSNKDDLVNNQIAIINKFIKKVTGLTDEQKVNLGKEVAKEVKRKGEILNKEELLSIVKNAVDKKYKIDLTPEQASSIAQIKAEVNRLKEIGLKTPESSPERRAWGMKAQDLEDQIDGIVNPNSYLDLANSIKAGVRASTQRIVNQDTYLGKTLEVASMGAELITSPVYKSLKAAVDASFALRQGYKILTKNPKAWWNANKEAFKVLIASKKASERFFKEFKADIVTSDLYQKAIDSGLALDKVEDFFPTPIGEKIPFLGIFFKNSDSAFSTFSQSARMDMFETMYKNYVKNNKIEPSEEISKGFAELANSISGRGSYGKYEVTAGIMNKVFFSGRYIKSAVDTFTMPFDLSLPKEVRAEAMKGSVGAVAGIVTVLTAASAFTEVGLDPRSSKFGKAKIPGEDRWVDLTAGLGSYVVLGTRTLLGISTEVAGITDIKPYVNSKGQETNLNSKKFGSRTIADVIGDFSMNKLAPAPSMIRNVLKGKDFSGKKPTITSAAIDLAAPISPENIVEGIMNSDDSATAQLIAAVADFLGASTIDYEKFK